MRIILMAVFFVLPWVSFTQGTWEKLEPPVMTILRSVCFTDSCTGWAAGDSGVILKTTDCGESWVKQESRTVFDIYDIFFSDDNHGWASAFNFSLPPYGTLLLKTSDGGATWNGIPYPGENIFIHCIYFSDTLHGWMGGSPHAIVHTSDGGYTWEQAAVDSSILGFFPVLCMKFFNARHGYAAGGMFDIAGVIWSTHDSGKTWQVIPPEEAPADEVRGLHTYDSMHVIGAGGDPDFGYGVGMIRTTNGGANWVYDEIGIQGTTFDIDFRTPKEAWAPLGPKRTIIFSLDSGNTWTEIPTAGNTVITDITFPDSLHGYAVGRDGAILRYIPPFHPGIMPLPGYNGEAAAMNCFRRGDRLVYELRVTEEGSGWFELMDVFGQVVCREQERSFQPGVVTGSPDSGNLRDGVYIARFIFHHGGGYTKPLIIIRKVMK